jgi:hypothetical protein
MLDRLAFYRDLIISQCLPGNSGTAPSLADYIFATAAGVLAALALGLLVKGLRGRDDVRSQRLKSAILDD